MPALIARQPLANNMQPIPLALPCFVLGCLLASNGCRAPTQNPQPSEAVASYENAVTLLEARHCDGKTKYAEKLHLADRLVEQLGCVEARRLVQEAKAAHSDLEDLLPQSIVRACVRSRNWTELQATLTQCPPKRIGLSGTTAQNLSSELGLRGVEVLLAASESSTGQSRKVLLLLLQDGFPGLWAKCLPDEDRFVATCRAWLAKYAQRLRPLPCPDLIITSGMRAESRDLPPPDTILFEHLPEP